ncbi:GtrA family protein [Nocardioides caeni]|uniref:GtrA family protein n=1 Tax=Nocardioides caeni TaxID=574700 RepID=A0A4S8NAN5_9ACTN|nr:GtrA family protein [Nocardioides caeni]THV12962.1 GtrA family protein [Nocardioides caeni]
MSPRIGSRSFDRYVLVGLANTALDLLIFSFLSLVVDLPVVAANAISTVVVMTISFFVNRAWVFRSDAGGLGAYVRFAGVTLFTGLLVQSLVIVSVLAACDAVVPSLAEEIAEPGAKLTAMAVGMVVNYLGYRWVFARSRPDHPTADDRRSPSAG